MQARRDAQPGDLLQTLAKPSAAYKRRAWLALFVLVLFVLAYLGLAGWFLLTAYQLSFEGDNASHRAWVGWLVGACAAFLAVFMLKGLFFVKAGGKAEGVEITAEQQPQLFKFLHHLADKIGAPRPHRVFLTTAVNAAVFYDLSLLNLFWPSKKNLEIGLGLVNMLSLGEFRAVLAHEFGHFAQRSMAVGRWVYVAQQIAAQLIARRDKLNDFLRALSSFDFRVAWVGWFLGVIVWSIRSLIDTAFRGVLLMQRALSREMEMNADLVAVSMTGSDALIEALHKLQAADELWGRALAFGASERAKGRFTRDLFTIQTALMTRMGRLYNDPHFGLVPPPADPAQAAADRRLFSAAIAQPPRMWMTHPLNHEREANAKRRYIAAEVDPRSAWLLFDQAEPLRERLSAELLEKPADQTAAEPDESLRELERLFEREALAGPYRGIYFGRSPTRWAGRLHELYAAGPITATFDALYPASLATSMECLSKLGQELAQLRALERGVMQSGGTRIDHRGRALTRRQLPQAISEVERELAEVNQQLQEHDRLCRRVHLTAAERLGAGWPAHLRGLLAVLHYADHSEANLRDLQAVVATSVHVVTATRRVNEAGVKRVLDSASLLRQAMQSLYEDASKRQLQLDPGLLEALDASSWTEVLGEFKLPYPDRANVGEWLQAADSWVDHLAHACNRLSGHALEQLLLAERRVAEAVRSGATLPDAPAACAVPDHYNTLTPGQERPRSTELGWWARFQLADGWLPATGRLLVAGAVVGTVLGFGSTVGEADLTIYNGLSRPVDVAIAGRKPLRVAAFGHASVSFEGRDKVSVEAHTVEGALIEHFDAEMRGRFANLVYNVAAAAPLVEWTVSYGNAREVAPRELGALRWISTDADVLFTEPPKSISTKGGGGTRTVLSGLGESQPGSQLRLVNDPAQRQQLIAARARWDRPDWIALLADPAAQRALLTERQRETPDDVMLGRFEQDRAGAQREAVCAQHASAAVAQPNSPDRLYLALRCREDGADRDQDLFSARTRFPANGWLAFLAGYRHAELGQWRVALDDYQVSLKNMPDMRDEVALVMARLQRLANTQGPVALQTLIARSPMLQQLVLMEEGSTPPGSVEAAYQQVGRGQLEAAVQGGQAHAIHAARLLRFAAASDGAPASLVQRALALPGDQGLDGGTLWSAVGLAARQGRSVEPLLAPLKESRSKDYDKVLHFVQALRKGQSVGQAQALMQGLQFELQSGCQVIGLVMLGQQAPAAWRQMAKRALFPAERPYFI